MSKLPADDPRHGTVNGYNNLACRCLACWAAASEAHRARRARNAAQKALWA